MSTVAEPEMVEVEIFDNWKQVNVKVMVPKAKTMPEVTVGEFVWWYINADRQGAPRQACPAGGYGCAGGPVGACP